MKTVSSAFLLAILTIALLEMSCALTPSASEGGSGVDPPPVVTLEYCIINSSTILRLDTGEQLDIIYTKDSTVVVTMNGSQTSIAVTRPYKELVCRMDDLPDDMYIVVSLSSYLARVVWQILMISITSYNIVIHVLYKKLRNPMGKLLLLYSIFFALSSGSYFVIVSNIYIHVSCYQQFQSDVSYPQACVCRSRSWL